MLGHSRCLLLGGPSVVRVGLDGLELSASGLNGRLPCPHDVGDFQEHEPRTRWKNSTLLLQNSLLLVTSICEAPAALFQSLAATHAPAMLSPLLWMQCPLQVQKNSAGGASLGHNAVSSELTSPLYDGNERNFGYVAAAVSSATFLDKTVLGTATRVFCVLTTVFSETAALGSPLLALPVARDSALDFDP